MIGKLLQIVNTEWRFHSVMTYHVWNDNIELTVRNRRTGQKYFKWILEAFSLRTGSGVRDCRRGLLWALSTPSPWLGISYRYLGRVSRLSHLHLWMGWWSCLIRLFPNVYTPVLTSSRFCLFSLDFIDLLLFFFFLYRDCVGSKHISCWVYLPSLYSKEKLGENIETHQLYSSTCSSTCSTEYVTYVHI